MIAKRIGISLFVILCCQILSFGCGKEQKGGAEKSGEKTASGSTTTAKQKSIGVSLLTMQHQFYQDLRAGLESEAAKHNYKLLITSAEFDSARQANQLDEFLVQKVDAIVVCPCDSKSVGASIVAANQAKVPVFTADIANTAPIGEVVSYIASDNKQGGREAAKLIVEAIGGKGKVAILSHPEVASVQERVTGFKEEIAKHADIQIAAELSSDGKRDKAARVMEDLLQSHPDLVGVFGINDDTALGALASVMAAGKSDKIKIVGYDATPEARAKIESGNLYGDVIQNPNEIGRLTINSIHELFEGRTPPKVVPVAVGTFTKKP